MTTQDFKTGFSNVRFTHFQAIIFIVLISGGAYLSTLQTINNGSKHPYATDVGEIQNALPRWGTLHFSGYPQYSLLGSLWTELSGLLQINPAAATSLFSMLWGIVTLVILYKFLTELHIQKLTAALVSLLFGFSLSMWVDSSIAEIHTFTMALTAATIWMAFRFGRTNEVTDLYWLIFLTSHGIIHTRAFAFIGLGVIVLTIKHLDTMLKNWKIGLLIFLTGPISYIYLPIRQWMGADWLFSNPGTLEGFLALVFDTKADRIIQLPSSLAEWASRGSSIWNLLVSDWAAPFLISGLIGLFLSYPKLKRIEQFSLFLIWIPILLLSLVIWEGRVSDALLAVKMPIILIAAIGLAFLIDAIEVRFPSSQMKFVLAICLALSSVYLFASNRGQVLEITQDDSATEITQNIPLIEPDHRQTYLVGLQGNGFWEMAYAAKFELGPSDLMVVDQNANFNQLLSHENRFITPSSTFYSWPLETWESRANRNLHLKSAAPDMIEISKEPILALDQNLAFNFQNGIGLRNAEIHYTEENRLLLTLEWQSLEPDLPVYNIAVHAIDENNANTIVSQVDRNNPVYGWYPFPKWQQNEVVIDHYQFDITSEANISHIRVGLYQIVDGQFVNSEWFRINLPN